MRACRNLILWLPLLMAAGCKRTGPQGQAYARPGVQTDYIFAHDVKLAAVPFVGCPSDGQQGPEPAPAKSAQAAIQLPQQTAAKLALYEGSEGEAVLAPRGWHCLVLSGSNGSFLIAVPQPVSAQQFFSGHFQGFTGPAVQISMSLGDTSGRFEVAQLIRRVFPKHSDFADDVLAEGLTTPAEMPAGPYPADSLSYSSPEEVHFITPAGQQGLGTTTRLAPGPTPIRGYALLTQDAGTINSTLLAVRLVPDDPALVAAMLQRK